MNYAYQRKSFVFKSDFNHMYALNCMHFLFMYAKSLKILSWIFLGLQTAKVWEINPRKITHHILCEKQIFNPQTESNTFAQNNTSWICNLIQQQKQ